MQQSMERVLRCWIEDECLANEPLKNALLVIQKMRDQGMKLSAMTRCCEIGCHITMENKEEAAALLRKAPLPKRLNPEAEEFSCGSDKITALFELVQNFPLTLK